MNNDYVKNKAVKKKTAKKAVWLLAGLGLIFIFIVLKFAQSSGMRFTTGGLPNGSDAFEVSKDFVRATVRSNEVAFPGSGFQFAKKSDSVYVVRSVVELGSDNGGKKTVNFRILMQYHGGKQDELKNWSLLNISEEQ
jgi:hypothetical protein